MFLSEDELQHKLVADLQAGRFRKIFGSIKTLEEKPLWCSSRFFPKWRSDIPDVVVHTRSEIFVMELKPRHVGVYAMQQIELYMQAAPQALGPCRQVIRGMVIGHHVARTVTQLGLDAAAKADSVQIMTYALSADGELALQLHPAYALCVIAL